MEYEHINRGTDNYKLFGSEKPIEITLTPITKKPINPNKVFEGYKKKSKSK
tara:strand:- start:83 stop:235 length:153 start_codon:yes stop_codon:yes gene_type:complete